MNRSAWILSLAAIVAVTAGTGCKKPRKFVRTKAQQERVDNAILSSAPSPKHVVNANFDDVVELIGIDIDPPNPAPGAKVTVHFYWKVLAELESDGDWMIFVHLEGPVQGGGVARVIADHYAVEDGPGGAGLYPPKEWEKGQIIKDSKTIDLVDPRGRKLGPGECTIYAGLFDMEAYRSRQADVRLQLKAGTTAKHDGKGRLEAAKFQVGKGTISKAKPFKAPTLQVRKATGPVTLDGKLDEPAWKGAVTTAAFGRPDGKPLPANMRTQVKMLWDDAALYMGFLVRDAKPESKFTKRDETLWDEDVVEVYLDPDGDSKNYVELQVSPKNVIFDALFTARRQPAWEQAAKWNMAGLQTAVHIGTLPGRAPTPGWTVEIRIPWADLAPAKGTKPTVGTKWRANFFRKELPGDFTHLASWSPVSDDTRADFHNLERAGYIAFVGPPPAARARVVPTPKPAAKVIPAPVPKTVRAVAPSAGVPQPKLALPPKAAPAAPAPANQP